MKLPRALAIAFALSTPTLALANHDPENDPGKARKEAREAAKDASKQAYEDAKDAWDDGGKVGPRPRRSEF